jgi:hypothetical protein
MTLKIYNLPNGGDVRHTESFNDVPVQQGTFHVTLGSATPLEISFTESLYVEVILEDGPGNDVTFPITFSSRTELTAAPYALQAINADTADVARTGDNLGNHVATQNVKLGSNYLSNDGDDEGVFIDTAGNVGIGTETPLSKLEVHKSGLDDNYAIVGTAKVTGAVTKASVGVTGFAEGYPNMGLNGAPSTSVGVMGVANYGNSGNAYGVFATLGDSIPNPVNYEGYAALYADGGSNGISGIFMNGKVGIGTKTPSQTLHVNGTTQTTNLTITSEASNGYILRSDASGNASWVSPSALSGSFLPLSGGTLTGAITSTNDPSITMGKGNFGSSNTNAGIQAFVAGENNHARGNYSVSSGGGGATAADSNSATGEYATVGGGRSNVANYDHATIGGGYGNQANRYYTFIGGGYVNTISASYGTIGGGAQNVVSQQYGIVSGGSVNTASGLLSTVGGGATNTASGDYSTVSGGELNSANGAYSFAAGRRAQALHDGSFVWADQTDEDFSSTGTNQFLIRATGGMRIYSPTGNADAKVESNSGHTYMSLSSISGKEDAFVFQTTSSGYKNRWAFGKSVASESGSNAGSDFFINRYDDAGSYLGQPFTIIRSSGYVGINTSSNKSTLDVNGSVGVRMKTNQIAGTNNPDETATTWIFTTGAGTINLPTASDCTNRLYVIINKTGATRTVSGFYDLSDTFQTSLATATALWVQSDGTNWLQVK